MKFPPINLYSLPRQLGDYIMNHVWDWGDDEDKAVYVGLEMAEEREKTVYKSCYGRAYTLKDECAGCVIKASCEKKSKANKLAHEEHLRNVLESSDHAKAMREAKQKQVGGDHYKSMAIQPVEYIHANNMNFLQGSVIKYISRYKAKNGKQDLEKAKHFIDLLIDLEYKS